MNPSYKGMRWLKCDLQMQTPADVRHWEGDRFVMGQEADAAKAFAEACYRAKLDVVGITDHNFLSKNFIPHLQSAFDEIEREFNHKITLFPGFEFEADVGKGMHVLCLFEPGTSVDEIDHILTECGVGCPRIKDKTLSKSTQRLPEILNCVQKAHSDESWRGIVIIPHVFQDSLFDNDRISEWLQQEEYRNPDLLAVEVPKPLSQMSDNFQKLFQSGDDCLPEWKRIRPIATLMSSDNKKLIDSDGFGRPIPNSIGYRYTWIKMSEPSIESLRQAFLDHDSRIILPEDVSADTHPAFRIRYGMIKSISIKNVAFLADQEMYFSSNLNCVIGGRGTGKSTLLEYLRIILGKDKPEDLDAGTKERINRIRDTLNSPNAELKVCWVSADGVEDHIVWENNGPTVQNRDMADPETFFNNLPIRFYSQQQLNNLTESKIEEGGVRQAQRLLELVDGFTKNELNELADQERKLKLQIQEAFTSLRKAKMLEKECNKLLQEHQELERQWKARSEIQEYAHRHQKLKAESRYLDGLLGIPGKQFADVAALSKAVAASHISFDVKDSPHGTWFLHFDEKVKAAKEALAKRICEAVEEFETIIEKLKSDDIAWTAIQEELDKADENFSEACAAKGLTTDDVGHLQEINQTRAKKQNEIEEIGCEIQRLKDEAGDPEVLMQRLHGIWREQFQCRVEAAERANDLAVLSEHGQRFIEVSAKYQQDQKNFRELWQRFAPSDGRTRLGKNWERCGEVIFKSFVDQDKAVSPWQVLQNQLSPQKGSDVMDFGVSFQELSQHIQDNLEQWEKLRCSRVQDTVDMKLYRSDGSLAGSIAEGSLSDGQRNTAALALLLAQEGGPLVIDQPEDELDSNFVFRELIPMLRKVKSKRQLIMATHNANLPVNGDAELVYAFEARDGKGEMLACGGLDQRAVTKAVLDIMEGTEEAFRRRREKYHF
ncbi:TrlF family AAA-like ATPase [Desulfotignum balticum]|uniref:TrlF family AAA-like ATPase n=1 Tax=Desulfotignum balticum TaxID=115781 RepID=UPI00041BDF9F|nr:AAA family ATPase [Desulfotignum balticum]